MQQPQISSTSGSWKAALYYGLPFGGIIGLLDVLYYYYWNTTNFDPSLSGYSQPFQLFDLVGDVLFYLPLCIFLFLFFFLAGFLATQKTQRVSSGRLAGLIVGTVFLLVDVCVGGLLLTYLIIFPQMAQALSASDLASAENALLRSDTPLSIVVGLILLGAGALFGTIGGSQARKWRMSFGILAGLIFGYLCSLVGFFFGCAILGGLIGIPFIAQGAEAASETTQAEISLVVALLVTAIGVGLLFGAIRALLRNKRSI